jgi:hypothetical protein
MKAFGIYDKDGELFKISLDSAWLPIEDGCVVKIQIASQDDVVISQEKAKRLKSTSAW